MLMMLLACASAQMNRLDEISTDPVSEPPPTPEGPLVFQGATLLLTGEGVSDALYVDGTQIGTAQDHATVIDVAGRFIVPAFIDSHVHFAYQPDVAEMLDRGVVAAVDLAAPIESLSADLAPMAMVWAGPMVTASNGYPTQSWGSDGYGLECDGEADARAAVAQLAEAGAGVIKLPITGAPVLGEEALRGAVEEAARWSLPVVVHALGDEEAALGASVGAQVLAHTPTAPLSEETLARWRDGAVMSTLAAFGGSTTAVENLRALRSEGTTVLYGTDFGNLRTPGISAAEIALLQDAGMTGEDILMAGTHVPAAFWGLDSLGTLAVGRDASFLILRADPRIDPTVLADPEQVWVGGMRRR